MIVLDLTTTLLAQPPAPQPSADLGGGEAVLFWVLAPIMVLAALGLLFVRKAVHAAMLVAAVMVCLAIMYAAQEAPFLFAAQIVVYTGAVMMLFLFVLMLVGVDSSDSLVETIKGQRLAGVLGGLGLALLLISTVTGVDRGPLQWNPLPDLAPAGLEAANADGNPVGVARLIFGDFVFAFEAVGTLLITAALGAILLTHSERLWPKRTQKDLSRRRLQLAMRENPQPQDVVAPLPAPGVFARSNAVDTPALLPDGTPSDLSVSRVLRARGQEQVLGARERQVAVIEADIAGLPYQPADAAPGGPGDAAAGSPDVPLAGKADAYDGPAAAQEGPASEGAPPVAEQPASPGGESGSAAGEGEGGQR